MPNFDGRYELRATYSVPVGGRFITHRISHDVQPLNIVTPGEDFDAIDVEMRGGGTTSLSLWVAAFFNAVRVNYPNTVTFSAIELWDYGFEPSQNASFVSSSPQTFVGSSLGQVNPAHQLTLTFRSASGGSARVQLMESVSTVQNAFNWVDGANIGIDGIMQIVIASTSAFRARDNAVIIAASRVSGGQNEAIARKRFRTE